MISPLLTSPMHQKVIIAARAPFLSFRHHRKMGSKSAEEPTNHPRLRVRCRTHRPHTSLITPLEILGRVSSFQIVSWLTALLTHISTGPINYTRSFTRAISGQNMRPCGHCLLLDTIHACHGLVSSTWSSSMGTKVVM
jgi:hypothetical protein